LNVFAYFAADLDHSNDTLYSSFTGMPLMTLSYIDKFDLTTNYWAQEGNVWERGAPSQTNP